MIVTCKTDDCENKDIPIEIPGTYMDVGDVERPVTEVQCGVCLQMILTA